MAKSDIDDTKAIDKKDLAALRKKKIDVKEKDVYAGRSSGAFFVFLTGPDSGQVVTIDKAEITIGRYPGSDIVIDESVVSKQHAKVLSEGKKHLIVDNGSTNGIYVNEKQVKKATLKDKDEVQVANIIIKYFQIDLDAEDATATEASAGGPVGSPFYQQVIATCEPVFGPRTAQFVNRQIAAHIGKTPRTLTLSDRDELARWIKVSAGLLLNDEGRAEDLADAILLIE